MKSHATKTVSDSTKKLSKLKEMPVMTDSLLHSGKNSTHSHPDLSIQNGTDVIRKADVI